MEKKTHLLDILDANAPQQTIEDIMRENEEMKQRLMCTVCLDKFRCIVFLPCRHLLACEQCGLPVNTCMRCNTMVKEHMKVIRAVSN
ncbi:baculoviral IAP repeat-containing protein 8-like [Dreissena polymorpha]|uniref:RING-type domain-containing protein n=1 Tax=Dreissena polymorpha TaxID=45954 RepID=A0A9D4HL57_DREPO|nr:baculoviral IAP repeat-containing protein 8-like [Dreissena polymorpha]KAH3724437.1 hypothetical protein DPMN_050253 [Dreissena polymorpha]